jgi:SAM-dependent methyltransferase
MGEAAQPTPNLHTPELFAEAYEGRNPEFYSGLLGSVIRSGTPGSVVDLGAGLGLFVELAEKWGLDAVGLEGSAFAVEEAKRRVPNLRMQVHDLGGSLPFDNDSVANIVLNQVIEHIDPDRFRRLLRECHRVLCRDGTIFISSPSRRNLEEQKEPTHINMLLPSVLKRNVEEAGFRVVAEPNYGFWFSSGESRILNILADIMLRIFPDDWFSATANIIVKK